MPAVLKIDPRRRIVCSAFYGEVRDQDLLRHREKIAADPDFNPAYSEIVDFTGVVKLAVSEATLMALAGAQSLYDKTALHVVVAPAELSFAIASKYETLVRDSRPNFKVVRTLKEAYQALGIEAG